MTRWPGLDPEAVRAANRKQARRAGRARRSSSRSGPRRGSSCRPPTDGARRSSCCPGPPRELQRDVARGRRRPTRSRARDRRARSSCARRCCGCSASRSRRSPRRCARPRTPHGLDGAGDHDLPAPRRGRGRHPLRARRRRGLRRVRGDRPRAPRRHAVLRPTADDRRAGRRRCCAAAAGRSRPPSRAPAACWPGAWAWEIELRPWVERF